MKLSVYADFQNVERMLSNLPTKVVDEAARLALNRAADTGKSRMTREIRREYALPSDVVRDRLRVSGARKGGGFEITATLAARGKRSMNVIRFLERSTTLAEARRRAKGGTASRLYVQIKRSGGKKPLPLGAFIGNKGRTVFQRVGKARLPIKPITTIDIPSMFNSRRLNRIVRDAMVDTFRKRFQHEAQRLLSR